MNQNLIFTLSSLGVFCYSYWLMILWCRHRSSCTTNIFFLLFCKFHTMPSANKSLGPDLVNRPLKFCSNLLTVRHQAQDPVPSAVLFGWRCGKTCCEASGSNVTWKRQNKPGRNRNTHTHTNTTPNKQKSRNGWAASTVKTFLFYGCCRIKYCKVLQSLIILQYTASTHSLPDHFSSFQLKPLYKYGYVFW